MAEDPAGGQDMVRRLMDRFSGWAGSVAVLETDARGRVRHVNPALARRLGETPDALLGRDVATLLTGPDGDTVTRWVRGDTPPAQPVLLNFVSASHEPFTLRCLAGSLADGVLLLGEFHTEGMEQATDELMRLNNAFAVQARELSRRTRELEQARAELAAALEEATTSRAHLQRIQETVPICMRCEQVKTGEFEWAPLLHYLRDNSIYLSHGYCPACYETVVREFGLEGEQ